MLIPTTKMGLNSASSTFALTVQLHRLQSRQYFNEMTGACAYILMLLFSHVHFHYSAFETMMDFCFIKCIVKTVKFKSKSLKRNIGDSSDISAY